MLPINLDIGYVVFEYSGYVDLRYKRLVLCRRKDVADPRLQMETHEIMSSLGLDDGWSNLVEGRSSDLWKGTLGKYAGRAKAESVINNIAMRKCCKHNFKNLDGILTSAGRFFHRHHPQR